MVQTKENSRGETLMDGIDMRAYLGTDEYEGYDPFDDYEEV